MATLPPIADTKKNATTLPQEQSALLSFADTLSAATNLAKQERNRLSLDIMAPYRGTVAASDFNGILGNLNQASDTFASDVIKKAVEADTPKYDTITDAYGGVYEVQKDATGRIIGEPRRVFSGKAVGGGEGSDLLSVTEASAFGVPYGTTKAQAAAMGKVPTGDVKEYQAKAALFATRLTDSDSIIGKLETDITKMNPISYQAQVAAEGTTLGNAIVNDKIRQQRQAERNFLNAVLRRESGAVISPSEFAEGARQYFPRPGDDAETLRQKKQNRDAVIANITNEAGPALRPAAPTTGTTSSGLKYKITK